MARNVAKPILMLDLDGRGTRDNTESDFRRKVHGEGGIGVNDTNIICTLMSVSVTCGGQDTGVCRFH